VSVALLKRSYAAGDRARAGRSAAGSQPAPVVGVRSAVRASSDTAGTLPPDAAGASPGLTGAHAQTLAGLAVAAWASLADGGTAPCLLCGATMTVDRSGDGELQVALCSDCGTTLR
jgi:hypothetical protein